MVAPPSNRCSNSLCLQKERHGLPHRCRFVLLIREKPSVGCCVGQSGFVTVHAVSQSPVPLGDGVSRILNRTVLPPNAHPQEKNTSEGSAQGYKCGTGFAPDIGTHLFKRGPLRLMSVSSPDGTRPPDIGPSAEGCYKPVDFGSHRRAILQALELNSRLLHDPGLDVDEPAMRDKIDELLDRLNNL